MLRSLIVALLAVVSLSGASWDVSRVMPSLARLTVEGREGNCTAFAIHEKKGHWVTMSHCLPDTPTDVRLNGDAKLLEVLYRADGDTPAAVFVADKGAHALKLGDEPKRGDDILQIGFGAGSGTPFFYEGLLVSPSVQVTTVHETEVSLQFNSAHGMPGMSGGPLINRKYRVVGVISGGMQPTPVPSMLSFSPRYVDLKALIDKFGG
jgi:S1-C subfamily serine protease